MKGFILLYFSLHFISIFSQSTSTEVWQGIMYKEGEIQDGKILYLELTGNGKNITGKSREEIYKSEEFCIQRIKGHFEKKELYFKQYYIETKKKNSRKNWSSFHFKASYNDSSGYLTGSYSHQGSKKTIGKIILYKSNLILSSEPLFLLSHPWRDLFIDELSKNKKSPDKRAWERKNFPFKPIYFDYDKDELKSEYLNYLKSMILVILDHTDLRILATGHTDADGSNEYNIDLSQRRSKAIRDFMILNGLPKDRLIIDFKGEGEPVDRNDTDNGKQRNRRVDFQFI